MSDIFHKGIGGHHRAFRGRTDEWLTPLPIIKALGEFDLDPCSPVNRPWPTATKHYTVDDDGLKQPWSGRVFLNPPYGPQLINWMGKLANHGDGIALIFARTETKTFFQYVWPKAHAILFIEGRISFCDVSGKQAKTNSGGPSVLIAYGQKNADILEKCGIKGQFITLKTDPYQNQEALNELWQKMVEKSKEVKELNKKYAKPTGILKWFPTNSD